MVAYKSCVLIQGPHPLKDLRGLCEVEPAGAGSVWPSGPQKDTASEPGRSKKYQDGGKGKHGVSQPQEVS